MESFEGRGEPPRPRPLRSNSQIHSQLAAVHESESGTKPTTSAPQRLRQLSEVLRTLLPA